MVRVQCPYCQRRYRTELEAFGRTAVCTKCSQAFKIGESRPPFQWQNTDLAEDSWIGVPPPEEKQEMKHCIICDAPLRPNMVRCPECGANQVTGVVHKTRRLDVAEESSIWSVIPLRLILILLAIAAVGGGIYWGVKSIARQGVELGDELADAGMVARVAKAIQNGEDEWDLSLLHTDYVRDANIERFSKMLSAGDPHRRHAAILLIGCGRQTRLAPLLSAAREPDTASAALAALEAIGPRRLIELSNHADEQIRKEAVEGLTLLFDLDDQDPRVARLADAPAQEGPAGTRQKIALLNEICRPWPELAGTFVIVIDGVASPFTVAVEQIGKTFYLLAGDREFTSRRDDRRFNIPIHHWCVATGSAVDGRSVRELIGGAVSIDSPFGAEWQGEIMVASRRNVVGGLPGFLPFEAPPIGREVQAGLRLERPGR